MAGVVFNAVAVAHLLHHFQVEHGALFQALGFHQAVAGLELGQILLKFRTYIPGGSIQVVAV